MACRSGGLLNQTWSSVWVSLGSSPGALIKRWMHPGLISPLSLPHSHFYMSVFIISLAMETSNSSFQRQRCGGDKQGLDEERWHTSVKTLCLAVCFDDIEFLWGKKNSNNAVHVMFLMEKLILRVSCQNGITHSTEESGMTVATVWRRSEAKKKRRSSLVHLETLHAGCHADGGERSLCSWRRACSPLPAVRWRGTGANR